MKHISNSYNLFRTRAREAIEFLNFLRIIEQTNTYVSHENKKNYPIKPALRHILKANFSLLLYNAIEGVFTQLIEDINESIIESSINNIDELKTELFKYILIRFKNSNDFSYNTIQPPLSKSIMQFWMNEYKKIKGQPRKSRNKENSGNIDGKIIHEDLLIRYGIIPGTQKKTLRAFSHWSLQLNKDRRNHLAHGEQSFVDLGRNLSVEDLAKDAKFIYKTLRHIAIIVNLYLDKKGYLEASSWQTFFESTSYSST